MVLIVALIFGGCQLKTQNQQGNTTDNGNKNIFTSIKDAIDKQIVLKCEYNDEETKTATTYYIKGKVVRMRGTGEQSNIDGLLKDNKFYFWDNQKKEGMILDMAKMAEDGNVSMGDQKVKSTDDVINKLEERKTNCVASPESSGLLEVPTDVKFADTLNSLAK